VRGNLTLPGSCSTSSTSTTPGRHPGSHPRGRHRAPSDYHQLIERFGKATDVPVLLNTSFNLKGEPIVNTSDPTSGR